MQTMRITMTIALGAALLAGTCPAKTYTRDEFRIRDPFVLPDAGTYYLYESKPWNGGNGVEVRTSKDLENWSEKTPVMTLPARVGCTAVWAPEVHKHAGKYWLFTTLTRHGDPKHPVKPMLAPGFKGGGLTSRGVWIFRSDSPKGPFQPVKEGPVTPAEWMCLDGTLWIEDGKPWMVFCHEWCQTGNGRMMAAPLTDDLSGFAAEPKELFRASGAMTGAGHVTDGPFLYSEPGKGLWMIWSNFLEGSGYCVLQCKSASGKVAGPWRMSAPLFRGDGGHGMIFRRFDGQLMLTLHQPNHGTLERMKLFPLGSAADGLVRTDCKAEGESR